MSEQAKWTPRTTADAPTITEIDPTNRTLTVAFTPPPFDGGAPITGYQYTLDGGTSWAAAGTSTSPLVLGGLTNGQVHQVMLHAITDAGAGAASSATAASAALEPESVGGNLPSVPVGTSELLINGVAQQVVVLAAAAQPDLASTSAYVRRLAMLATALLGLGFIGMVSVRRQARWHR